MNNQYDNIVDALSSLKERGYTKSFSVSSNGLYCPTKEKIFIPDQVRITEFHRFEGNTNPDDMAIIYAIETSDGCRGVIIDAYGTYANSKIGDFLKKALQD